MKVIDGQTYLRMLRCGAAHLDADRTSVNDLNVFPIPDGDTGDNMFMTLNSGVGAATSLAGESLGAVASAVSSGMLLGARGNSGVILSRIFSGIGKGFSNVENADLDILKSAMRTGVTESYGAVLNPVEGTILTVFKDAVNAAENASDIEGWFGTALTEMSASLDRTPDLLPVLKEAGVVDSGGAGLLCIFQGMQAALLGEETGEAHTDAAPTAHSVNLDAFTPDSTLEFGYCTEFLLRLQSSKVDLDTFDESVIKDWLTANGESVVCFRDGSIVKVHVHTMHPGDILSHVQQWGEFLTLKVENMMLQHSEARIRNNFRKQRKPFGCVTVASGKGLSDAFREAGADEVIEGGQTMNPSSGDFIEAFGRVNADTVFVFPNNSNIILAAKQAAELYKDSKVVVLPSKTIAEGYVALASIDFSGKDASVMEDAAKDAIAGVTTGLVSRAIRTTVMDGVDVREGDWIGFSGGAILNDGPSAEEVALDLCDKLEASDHDVVLIFSGEDAKAPEELKSALEKKYRRTEFVLTDGGQSVYDYILALC